MTPDLSRKNYPRSGGGVQIPHGRGAQDLEGALSGADDPGHPRPGGRRLPLESKTDSSPGAATPGEVALQ
jgi:hypothetical protein